jgi:hypothetical protein
MKSHDMAFEALQRASKRNGSKLPDTLLRKAYDIQIRHQFEKDRDIPLREMSRLIEDHINNAVT